MESFIKAAASAVEYLKALGADAGQCFLIHDDITEVNVDGGDLFLIRTYQEQHLTVTAEKDHRMGSATSTSFDEVSVREAAENALRSAAGAERCEWYTINPTTERRRFSRGSREVDPRMFARVNEFADWSKAEKGETLDEFTAKHYVETTVYVNNYGAELIGEQCFYTMGDKGIGCSAADMERPLQEIGYYAKPYDAELLQRPVEPLGDKFEGTLIYDPRIVRHEWWLATLSGLMGDEAFRGEDFWGRHRWADKLGQAVASPGFSMAITPNDPALALAPFFYEDGKLAEDAQIIENGILKAFPISRKSAQKLGLPQTIGPNDEEYYTQRVLNIRIEPGEQSLQEIIAGVEHGILLTGTMPGMAPYSPDGAFNSVIRGGLLIENGRIVCRVSEVMVAGNYFDKFMNIRAISKETRRTGGDVTPWIAFDGFTFQQ